MNMSIYTSSRCNHTFASNRFGTGTNNDIDTSLNIRITGLA